MFELKTGLSGTAASPDPPLTNDNPEINDL